MGIQAIFDKQAINMLPKISEILTKTGSSEANQMRNLTIREVMNSNPSLEQMNNRQLEEFQNRLIDIFKFHNWLY